MWGNLSPRRAGGWRPLDGKTTKILLLSATLFAAGQRELFAQTIAAPAGTPPGTALAPVLPPSVNPGRPTVTDIASLTAPGYLEMEAGLNLAKHGPEFTSQYYASALFKVTGKDGRNEFRLSNNVYTLQGLAGGGVAHGFGDLTLGVQHLLTSQSPGGYDTAIRAEYKVPTAGRDIGTGRPDYNLLLLASRDYSPRLHADYNVADALLGEHGTGCAQQFFASAAASYARPPHYTVQAELYAFSGNRLNGTNAAHGYGITYTPRPDSEFDAYVNFGLTRGAPKFFITIGHTFFLERLF